MSKPMIRIHNLETDEIIDREMTDTEFAQYQAEQEQMKAAADLEVEKLAEALAAKAAAEAKLLALGLTTDDLKALGLGSN